MSDWDRFSELMASLASASLAWFSVVLAPALPVDVNEAAGNRPVLMIGWAQDVDEPVIEQVGEGTGEDVETLDESRPPAEDPVLEEDIETLDEGSPPDVQDEDIELLDQSSPPATTVAAATESPAPAPSAAVTESPAPTTVPAPTTTYVIPEPVVASGPVLPAGFGTGNVHVSAGAGGFPAGLGDCHVGAVTGRAYVGIDCGDGSMFVGHAPSSEEFPFVVDEGFPFNRESAFSDPGGLPFVLDEGFPFNRESGLSNNAEAPVIRTSGASSVELTQEVREQKPRVRNESRDAKRQKDSDTGSGRNAGTAAENDRKDGTKDESVKKKKPGNTDTNNRLSVVEQEQDSKNVKKQGSKKHKRIKEDRQPKAP